MESLSGEARRPLPNPFRTQKRVVGWIVVGLWVLFISFLLLSWNAIHTQQLTRKEKENYVAPVAFIGIFAAALPIGYFILVGEARRVELARHHFMEGRYLVRWEYRPSDWTPYARWCRKHARGAARRLDENRPLGCCVSTVAAYANGAWILWGTSNRRLASVDVIGGTDGVPLMLRFCIAMNNNTYYKHVLVPAGEAELANVVAGHIRDAGNPGGSAWIKALSVAGRLSQLLR